MLISDQIKQLDLNLDQLIVIGSGIMNELTIRPAHDIDIVVSQAEHQRLLQHPDFHHQKATEHDDYVIFSNHSLRVEIWSQWWNFKNDTKIDYAELINNSLKINGVRFISLNYLRRWKLDANRPKDAVDVKLIDTYLENLNT